MIDNLVNRLRVLADRIEFSMHEYLGAEIQSTEAAIMREAADYIEKLKSSDQNATST